MTLSFCNSLLVDIVGQYPGLSVVLEEWGIDSCRLAGHSLRAVCALHKLDLNELCRALELARQVNPEGLACLSRSQLVAHVRSAHHDYLRVHLPSLLALCTQACRLYATQYQQLRHVEEIVRVLVRELDEHVQREEQFAFPWLGSLDLSPLDLWMLDSLAEERRKSSFRFNCLRFLTNHFTPPGGAGDSLCRLYSGLRELDRNFQRHVYVEERYLFPRQLAA